jgi:hypothetical protein
VARRLQSWLSILWLVAGLACLVFVAVYAAASAAQTAKEPKLKALWDEYPLDPSASESPAPGSKQARPRGSAASRQQPTAPRQRPAASRQQPSSTEPAADRESDSSSSFRLALLAGVGLAMLLAAVSALSLLLPTGRRKRRAPPPAPAAAKAKATAVKAGTAPRPKRKKLLGAEREREAKTPEREAKTPERVVTPAPPAAPSTQRALPAASSAGRGHEPARAAEPARDRRVSTTAAGAKPATDASNGRAAASAPAGENRPAVRAEEPQRHTGERQPNGSPRPATTWFTEPHESCEIALWRGYVRGQFYARPTFPEPGDYALEVSPKFRLRGESPNPRGSALAAYEALIEKLVRRGWQPSGLGGEWFEQWFRRRLPTEHGFPPVEPAPAPPAQTPARPT